MAHICGVDLPLNKRGDIGLTYIHGIVRSTARYILEKLGIPFEKKTKEWSNREIAAIQDVLINELNMGDSKRSAEQMNIKRLLDIATARPNKSYKNPKRLPAKSARLRGNSKPGESLPKSILQEAGTAYKLKNASLMSRVKIFPVTVPENLTEDTLIARIRNGIKKSSLHEFAERTGISNAEMASILQLNISELSERKENELLTQYQTEKVLLIARLYNEGEHFFGDTAGFNKWMNSRVPAFGGKKPKEYLDTISGIQLVSQEIGRIQHGVFS